MNIQTQNIFRTTFPTTDTECIGRHLVSMNAVPNPTGGCSTVIVSFQFLGWSPGDLPEIYSWTDVNTGEVVIVGGCIDLTTFDVSCPQRFYAEWDDGINCCP